MKAISVFSRMKQYVPAKLADTVHDKFCSGNKRLFYKKSFKDDSFK